MSLLRIPVLRLQQPIGEVYVGSIPGKALWEISETDIREIQKGEDGIFAFTGIQRKLNEKRVEEIAEYVKTIDATFPTAVVLSASSDDFEFSKESGSGVDSLVFDLNRVEEIEESDDLFSYRKVVRVIDGQHRIEGLKRAGKENFDVNVAIFVDADMEDQARIFSVVNLAQTKVNKSLVYDLFNYSTTMSPEKTAHDVVVSLDSTENSPFFERIKRLGSSNPFRKTEEPLSQATVVEGILRHIVKDKIQLIQDRDTARRGKKYPEVTPDESRKLVLRSFFVNGQNLEIAELYWNYFSAIARRWPKSWSSLAKGNILPRTNGYRAFSRFFKDAYNHLASPGEVLGEDEFYEFFEKSSIKDKSFVVANYPPGTSGETKLYWDIRTSIGLPGKD